VSRPFEDERQFINHWAMFGTDAVLHRLGRKWTVGHGACQHPGLFKTKREAGAAAGAFACAMGLRHRQFDAGVGE
jgi:hypothetical protein